MTSRIAATSKRPAKGRAAFACAVHARGRRLFALRQVYVMPCGLNGLGDEDQVPPGGGSV